MIEFRGRVTAFMDESDFVIRFRRRIWSRATIERIAVNRLADVRLVRLVDQRLLLLELLIERVGTKVPELRIVPVPENQIETAWALVRAIEALRVVADAATLIESAEQPSGHDQDIPGTDQGTTRRTRRRGRRGSGRGQGASSDKAIDSIPRELGSPTPPIRAQRTVRLVGKRAGQGRPVWLWNEGGQIKGSFAPVGGVESRRLTLAEVADLLLAEPSKTRSAILSLAGTTDYRRAFATVRGWSNSDDAGTRRVVRLMAADIAGRSPSRAAPRGVAGRNRDGSIRTISGGLPGMGKRR